jgi:hypothetical protein
MLMDKYFLSEDQAITADADSTNTLDLESIGIGNLGSVWLNVRVGAVALADGTSTGELTIRVLSSADDTTWYVNAYSPPLTEAGGDFAIGSWLLKMPLPSGVRRYLKLHYDANTLTAGTVTAFLSDHADQAVSAGAVVTPAN